MLYQRIYDQIINRAKIRILTEYSEKHHIVPRCLGGTNDLNNIVKLTFREHFLCHWLLCKIYPNNHKLIHAFSRMVHFSSKNYERGKVLNSKHFEIVKKYYYSIIGKWNKGRPAWNKGMRGEEYRKKYKNGGLTPPNMLGYKWINDGKTQKKLKPNEIIPENWKYGRIDIKGNNNPMRKKNVI